MFKISHALALSLITACAAGADAQCQLLLRESFRPGERPHGGNGRLREAGIHDTLKDFWPQVPSDGTRWISGDTNSTSQWTFAGSSLDPAETDPLDPYNGTAFSEAGGAAVIPFVAPSAPFRASCEAVMGFGTDSATFMGYTSNPAVVSNFETFGTLWMSLNGRGEWAIYANGSDVVASGVAPIVGTLDSGWLHMEFTFDPVSSLVSGRVMNTPIPATHIVLARPMLYFGMEAHSSWNVINNISVSTGELLSAAVVPAASACAGGTVVLEATTNAPVSSLVGWTRADGGLLSDGVQPDGSVLSGAQTRTLTISNANPSTPVAYGFFASNDCGFAQSNLATVKVCPADFDCSGGVDGDDVITFFTLWDSADLGADFNHDSGVDGDDVIAFFEHWDSGC